MVGLAAMSWRPGPPGWARAGLTGPGSPGQASGSDERAQAGDGAPDYQGVDLPGPLVGVDRLGVRHEPADLVLEQDPVAAEQFPGVADGLPPAHRAERLRQ